MALPSEHQAGFLTTRWSVLRAAGGDGEAARRAFDDLAAAYWYPLYAYGRRLGADADAAEDLVQDFLLRLFERGELQRLQPERGRFRAFLKVAFKNHLHNARAAARAQKRGGGRRLDGESRYGAEPSHAETPEALFDRAFAQATLEQALALIGADYAARGQAEVFAALAPSLGGGDEGGYQQIADRLGMGAVAVKVAAHRLRRRFGEQLRQLLAGTVDDPADVDDELRALRAACAIPPDPR